MPYLWTKCPAFPHIVIHSKNGVPKFPHRKSKFAQVAKSHISMFLQLFDCILFLYLCTFIPSSLYLLDQCMNIVHSLDSFRCSWAFSRWDSLWHFRSSDHFRFTCKWLFPIELSTSLWDIYDLHEHFGDPDVILRLRIFNYCLLFLSNPDSFLHITQWLRQH